MYIRGMMNMKAAVEEQEMKEDQQKQIPLAHYTAAEPHVLDPSRIVSYVNVVEPMWKTHITDSYAGPFHWTDGKAVTEPLPKTSPHWGAKYIIDPEVAKESPGSAFREVVYINPVEEKISDPGKIKLDSNVIDKDIAAAKMYFPVAAEEKNDINEGYLRAFGKTNDDVIARYNELLAKNPNLDTEELFKEAAGLSMRLNYTIKGAETKLYADKLREGDYSKDANKKIAGDWKKVTTIDPPGAKSPSYVLALDDKDLSYLLEEKTDHVETELDEKKTQPEIPVDQTAVAIIYKDAFHMDGKNEKIGNLMSELKYVMNTKPQEDKTKFVEVEEPVEYLQEPVKYFVDLLYPENENEKVSTDVLLDAFDKAHEGMPDILHKMSVSGYETFLDRIDGDKAVAGDIALFRKDYLRAVDYYNAAGLPELAGLAIEEMREADEAERNRQTPSQ
jgi:hypothetical protein